MKYTKKGSNKAYKYQTGGPTDPPDKKFPAKSARLARFSDAGNEVISDVNMPYMKLSDYADFKNSDLPMLKNMYYDPYNSRYLLGSSKGTYKVLNDKQVSLLGYDKPERYIPDKSPDWLAVQKNNQYKKFLGDVETHVRDYPDVRGPNSEPGEGDVTNYYRNYLKSPDFTGRLNNQINENKKRLEARNQQYRAGRLESPEQVQPEYVESMESMVNTYTYPYRIGPHLYKNDPTKNTSGTKFANVISALLDKGFYGVEEKLNIPGTNSAGSRKGDLARAAANKTGVKLDDRQISKEVDAIRGLRYNLTKDGFIDPEVVDRRGDRLRPYSQERSLRYNLPKIKEIYGKEEINKALFDVIDDDTLIKQLLDYTSTTPKKGGKPVAAKYGGKVNSYNEGGPLSFLTSGLTALGGASPIGLATSIAMPMLSGLLKQKPPSVVMGASPGNYASGGWIGDAVAGMKRKGTVGSFTRQAKGAGMGVQAFANKVAANPEDYSTTTRRRANFARNVNK